MKTREWGGYSVERGELQFKKQMILILLKDFLQNNDDFTECS